MKIDILKSMEDGMQEFSKGQKRIAEYIINHYDKAAFLTAAKLGVEVGVSESTVVRFVIELGFEGYPEFQKALQELIRTKLTSFQRVQVTNQLIGDGDLLSKVLYSDIEKIKHTLESIDKDAFNSAVKNIVGARKIYILGMRASSNLAGFLNYGLSIIYDKVKLVKASSGIEIFEQLMSVGPHDVVIAVSFPRYSRNLVNAVNYAKQAGAKIIALTDSESSPIAECATNLLIAQSDMASFMDSLVAPMSVINALIVGVSRESGEVVTERLLSLEKIWDDYKVYSHRG